MPIQSFTAAYPRIRKPPGWLLLHVTVNTSGQTATIGALFMTRLPRYRRADACTREPGVLPVPGSSVLVLAAFGFLCAAPAVAQTEIQPGSAARSQGMQFSGTQPTGQALPGADRSAQGGAAQVMGQERLRQQLSQAGFQDVRVLDAAYLVQARTQDGNTVFMMINPPDGTMRTSSAQGAGTTGSTAGSAQRSAPGDTSGNARQPASGTGRTQ